MIKLMVFAFALLFMILTVYSQGESCNNHDKQPGICTEFPKCTSLVNEYRLSPKPTLDKIRTNQRSCGNRRPARDPLVCCSDGVQQVTTISPTSSPSAGSKLLSIKEGCGYTSVQHNRVVGGVPAEKGGWPWMALLGYRNSLGDISFKCGGSIISKRHVLTAAHCMRKDLTLVRLGEHDLSTTAETNHVDINIANSIPHPNYDKRDGHSDLSILVLVNEISFTKLITPICIPISEPERSKNLEGFRPFIAGWGRTTEGGKSANVLQEVQVPVVSNQECRQNYADILKVSSEKQFDNAVICAGYKEGGKDSCQGDSGGPLMYPFNFDGDFFYFQVGIVSYGIGCARSQVPGVYTRVSQFTDWIKNTVEST